MQRKLRYIFFHDYAFLACDDAKCDGFVKVITCGVKQRASLSIDKFLYKELNRFPDNRLSCRYVLPAVTHPSHSLWKPAPSSQVVDGKRLDWWDTFFRFKDEIQELQAFKAGTMNSWFHVTKNRRLKGFRKLGKSHYKQKTTCKFSWFR